MLPDWSWDASNHSTVAVHSHVQHMQCTRSLMNSQWHTSRMYCLHTCKQYIHTRAWRCLSSVQVLQCRVHSLQHSCIPSGEKAAEEEAVLEAQPSAPVQAGAAFWEELLKAGYQDLQQAQMEALGKGKRERRQVTPCCLPHSWCLLLLYCCAEADRDLCLTSGFTPLLPDNTLLLADVVWKL